MSRTKAVFITHPLSEAAVRRGFKRAGNEVLEYNGTNRLEKLAASAILALYNGRSLIMDRGTYNGIGLSGGSLVDLQVRSVPFLPEYYYDDKRFDQICSEVISAIRYEIERGGKVIGLASQNKGARFDGGKVYMEAVRGTGSVLTNGNTASAIMFVEELLELARLANVDLRRFPVAMIGASGSVGSLVSRILVERRLCKEVLLGTRDTSDSHMEATLRYVGGDNVRVMGQLEAFRAAPFVMIATSGYGQLNFGADDVGDSPKIISDFPRPCAMDPRLASLENLVVTSGPVVVIPENDYSEDNLAEKFAQGFSYPCLGEALGIAASRRFDLAHVGSVLDPEKVDPLQDALHDNGFVLAPIKYQRVDVDHDKIRRVGRLINSL